MRSNLYRREIQGVLRLEFCNSGGFLSGSALDNCKKEIKINFALTNSLKSTNGRWITRAFETLSELKFKKEDSPSFIPVSHDRSLPFAPVTHDRSPPFAPDCSAWMKLESVALQRKRAPASGFHRKLEKIFVKKNTETSRFLQYDRLRLHFAIF